MLKSALNFMTTRMPQIATVNGKRPIGKPRCRRDVKIKIDVK
jgi:hypothetical protein